MTFANREEARLGALLARLRRDHALSADRLAGLLGEQPAILAAWETGRLQISLDTAERIDRLAVRLNFASQQRWKERVTRAHGLEMLIGRDLKILAVSNGALTESDTSTGRVLTFPRETFIGRRANDILPSLDCTLIKTHGTGLSDLDAIGFFEGRVRCVRYSAELNYGRFARVGVFEYWPIETVDAGIVAHHVCHQLAQRPTLREPGVVVHWSEFAQIEE